MTTYMLDSSGYLYRINIVNGITRATRLANVNMRFKQIYNDYNESIILDFHGQLHIMKHNNNDNNNEILTALEIDVKIINFHVYIDCIVLIDINYDAHICNRVDNYTKKICHIDSMFTTYINNNRRPMYIIADSIYLLGADDELHKLNKLKMKTINNMLYICECVSESVNHDAHDITDDAIVNMFKKYDVIVSGLIIDCHPLITKIKNNDGWIYTFVNENIVISSDIDLLYKITIFNKWHSVYVDTDGSKYNIIDGVIIKNIELDNYHNRLQTKIYKKSANNIVC